MPNKSNPSAMSREAQRNDEAGSETEQAKIESERYVEAYGSRIAQVRIKTGAEMKPFPLSLPPRGEDTGKGYEEENDDDDDDISLPGVASSPELKMGAQCAAEDVASSILAGEFPVEAPQSADGSFWERPPLSTKKRRRLPTMNRPVPVTPDAPFNRLPQGIRDACSNAGLRVVEGQLDLPSGGALPTLECWFRRANSKGPDLVKVCGGLKATTEKRWLVMEKQILVSPAACIPWEQLLARMEEAARGLTCPPPGEKECEESSAISVATKILTNGGNAVKSKHWMVTFRRGDTLVAEYRWLHGFWFDGEVAIIRFAEEWERLVGRYGTVHLAQLEGVMSQTRIPYDRTMYRRSCDLEDQARNMRAPEPAVVPPPPPPVLQPEPAPPAVAAPEPAQEPAQGAESESDFDPNDDSSSDSSSDSGSESDPEPEPEPEQGPRRWWETLFGRRIRRRTE